MILEKAKDGCWSITVIIYAWEGFVLAREILVVNTYVYS